MIRKIMTIVMAVTVTLTVVSCDKIKSLTADKNKSPQYIDPITKFPAEVQAFSPPNVGYFIRKSGEKKDKLDKSFRENDEVSRNLFSGAEHYQIGYNYADRRYEDKTSEMDLLFKGDLKLNIYKMPSAENARKYIENWETAAKKTQPKMRVCKFEEMEEGGATDVGPPQIIKRLKHPNGSEVIFVQRGFLIYNKCYDDSPGIDSEAYWTNGTYLFEAHSSGHHSEGKPRANALPIIEDFMADYLTVSGGQ